MDYPKFIVSNQKGGVWWLSGRVLDWRTRGCRATGFCPWTRQFILCLVLVNTYYHYSNLIWRTVLVNTYYHYSNLIWRTVLVNTYYHYSNLIWRTVSRRVDAVIPSDHPRRVASRVILWYGLIHETLYCTPDQVTIMIIYLLYAFSDILSDFKTCFGL